MARPDDDEDDTYDLAEAMADRLKLKGNQRNQYIDEHMTGAGYKRVLARESYQRIKDDDEDDGRSRSWIPKAERDRSRSRSRRRDEDEDSF